MNELIKVSYESERPLVSARELHEFLGIATKYQDWFPRMTEYGFIENVDFNFLNFEKVQLEGGREVVRTIQDHLLTIPMAKEIAMIQRNEKGKQARQYFLSIEAAWNTPEILMARALKMADGKIKILENKVEDLTPKAQLAEHLFESDDTIDMLEMSKVACKKGVKIGRTNLFKFLRYSDVLTNDNQPYQRYMDWFEVVEQIYKMGDKTKIAFKPLVTSKGQAGIVKMLKKKYT